MAVAPRPTQDCDGQTPAGPELRRISPVFKQTRRWSNLTVQKHPPAPLYLRKRPQRAAQPPHTPHPYLLRAAQGRAGPGAGPTRTGPGPTHRAGPQGLPKPGPCRPLTGGASPKPPANPPKPRGRARSTAPGAPSRPLQLAGVPQGPWGGSRCRSPSSAAPTCPPPPPPLPGAEAEADG